MIDEIIEWAKKNIRIHTDESNIYIIHLNKDLQSVEVDTVLHTTEFHEVAFCENCKEEIEFEDRYWDIIAHAQLCRKGVSIEP